MVSRDVGFRPAVPLPAVAILYARAFHHGRAHSYLTRLERVAALWKPLYFNAVAIGERPYSLALRSDTLFHYLCVSCREFDALANETVEKHLFEPSDYT